MKILKTGVLPEDRIYTIVCQTCHTWIEFNQKEGKTDGSEIRVKCSFCKRETYNSVGLHDWREKK